jgi:hypothetical protein
MPTNDEKCAGIKRMCSSVGKSLEKVCCIYLIFVFKFDDFFYFCIFFVFDSCVLSDFMNCFGHDSQFQRCMQRFGLLLLMFCRL